jgi:alpha-mannosidase
VDQYYHGWNTSIDDRGNVHDIISTVIEALTEQPARTFVYAEIKFFSMWWKDASSWAIHDTLRGLLASDQWSFVNGGWCMHDEATSHYMGMIDQTTLGHDFLQFHLNVIPKTAWQLDPFGHSNTQASLLTATAGLDALFFGRIDYQDLSLRHPSAECEGLWQVPSSSSSPSVLSSSFRPPWTNGNTSHTDNKDDEDDKQYIFWGLTGSYGGNYGSPEGFCFDALCPEAETLVGANSTRLLERINELLVKLAVQSNQTKGQHIMLTMGTDFTVSPTYYSVLIAELSLLTPLSFLFICSIKRPVLTFPILT